MPNARQREHDRDDVRLRSRTNDNNVSTTARENEDEMGRTELQTGGEDDAETGGLLAMLRRRTMLAALGRIHQRHSLAAHYCPRRRRRRRRRRHLRNCFVRYCHKSSAAIHTKQYFSLYGMEMNSIH
jgi:hypothetical protein